MVGPLPATIERARFFVECGMRPGSDCSMIQNASVPYDILDGAVHRRVYLELPARIRLL